MDRPDASRAELARSLRSLRGLNRYFGSYAIVLRFFRRWTSPGTSARILDLATGSADIPRRLVEDARRRGVKVSIRAVDFQPTTVALAREQSRDFPEISIEQADALVFDAGEKFDIVLCSLALHHFGEEDAVRLLRRCRELSRGKVLVADLRRGPLLRVGVKLLTRLVFRDRMTFADGRASAARAFSSPEMRELAKRAGWGSFGAGNFRFGRQAIWLESVG